MKWPEVMRAQVLALSQTVSADRGVESVDVTRCKILHDYIDDLEAGRLPAIEKARRG